MGEIMIKLSWFRKVILRSMKVKRVTVHLEGKNHNQVREILNQLGFSVNITNVTQQYSSARRLHGRVMRVEFLGLVDGIGKPKKYLKKIQKKLIFVLSGGSLTTLLHVNDVLELTEGQSEDRGTQSGEWAIKRNGL
ncbi:MAG: hypothetical protein JWN37_555 [Candidatus Nomurabacteria bacterium]|nr:hypothetical protein [Candidatus Nomurabacteria bacterium]